MAVTAWYFWPSPTYVSAPPPSLRPSEVPGTHNESEVIIRPQVTPVQVTQTAKPRADVPHLVRVAIGQDRPTARRYTLRSDAIWNLGNDLSEEAVDALLNYLMSTDDVLREERVDALKNDIVNILRSQIRISPKLSETLIAIFDAKVHGDAMLDYCIQHLGALQEASLSEEEYAEIYACLQRAALVPGASYAGTALVALTHVPNETDDMRHFLNERVASLIYDEDTHEAARMTATQIAAERGYTELLPIFRRMASDESTPVPQRIVAIGALGLFHHAEDQRLLESIRSNHPNARLLPALDAALKRFPTSFTVSQP